MTVTKENFENAETASVAMREQGHAVSARYNDKTACLNISLHNDVELTIPVRLIEGLSGTNPDQLKEIEISPSGLGLHWPLLDADVYVPALLGGVFGSLSWMASELGAKGGKVRSPAKTVAAQENGRKGGRPAKLTREA